MTGTGRNPALKYLLVALALFTAAAFPARAQDTPPEVQIDMSILDELNPGRSRGAQDYRAVPLTRPGQRLDRPALTGTYAEPPPAAQPAVRTPPPAPAKAKPVKKTAAAQKIVPPPVPGRKPAATVSPAVAAAIPKEKPVAAPAPPEKPPALEKTNHDAPPVQLAKVKSEGKIAPLPARRPANLKQEAKDSKTQRAALNVSRVSSIKPRKGVNMPAIPAVPVTAEDLPPLEKAAPAVTAEDGLLADPLALAEGADSGHGAEIAAALHEAGETAASVTKMPEQEADGAAPPAEPLAPRAAAPEKAPRKSLFSFLRSKGKVDKPETPDTPDPSDAAPAPDTRERNIPAMDIVPTAPGVSSREVAASAATAAVKGVPRPPSDINNYEQEYLTLPFPPGLEKLDKEIRQSLEGRVLPLLKNNPGWRLQIQAFASPTDSGPTSARRVSLSRGLEIRSWLMSQGIEARRMDVRALGMETDRDPADRVDLVFFDPVLR